MKETTQATIVQKELLELAKKKVKKQRDFFIHLFIYVVAIVVWLLKMYTDLPLHFFPIRYINWLVMSIWTVAIGIQGMELLFTEVILGKRWEEKKMKSFLEQESKKQSWE